MANKVYQIIQEKMIQRIEECIKTGENLPWNKPWSSNMAVKYITRKPYRGINVWLLEEIGSEFITYTQLTKLQKKNPEIKLKKGCKKHMVVFWKLNEYEKVENGEIETTKVPLLRYYNVYSISDVQGLETKFTQFTHLNNYEEVENIISSYTQNNNIKYSEMNINEAFFIPAKDEVCVPKKEYFEEIEKFYSVTFHELGHSTGIPTRLNRYSLTTSSKLHLENYSKEELVAEMTASMLLGLLNINTTSTEENSIAYLQGWMKAIKEDVSLIVSASAQAQKACDMIMGISCEDKKSNVA